MGSSSGAAKGGGGGATPQHKAALRAATDAAGYWLHRGNLAAERGDTAKAERLYARSQAYHDRMNELLGNS